MLNLIFRFIYPVKILNSVGKDISVNFIFVLYNRYSKKYFQDVIFFYFIQEHFLLLKLLKNKHEKLGSKKLLWTKRKEVNQQDFPAPDQWNSQFFCERSTKFAIFPCLIDQICAFYETDRKNTQFFIKPIEKAGNLSAPYQENLRFL